MSKTIWLGAVAYDPKVVTIWEGRRRYFHEEAHLPLQVVLFQSYEAQVIALLGQPGEPVPHIDIAWNTNLAYLQADEWSGHACRAAITLKPATSGGGGSSAGIHYVHTDQISGSNVISPATQDGLKLR
jgi:hypothetical protein